ncbi:MAG: hypothetical protein KF789_12575 [Bdellovibrionaceae bacterium]|nr:hypothetical protein [Pseudobdellovibrionaceae bacterium]
MRVFCLRFSKEVDSSWAELFLRWTPKVIVRPPNLIFLEIEETSALFGGEENLLKKVSELALSLAPPPFHIALSDSVPGAQMLSSRHVQILSPPGEEFTTLGAEPLTSLLELEGLRPWDDRDSLKGAIDLLRSLGLEKVRDLQAFSVESFRDRWKEMGVLLWSRMHGKEHQVISPLIAREPLYGYLYFEHPLGRLDFLRQALDEHCRILFLRLAVRGSFAQFIDFTFHGEYSKKVETIRIQPVSPSRDQELFLDLLLKRMEKMDLGNPVKEIEISIEESSERIEQLDFFEPRDTTRSRWERLISIASAAQLSLGFLKRSPALYPEKGFHLEPWQEERPLVKDQINVENETIQIKPSYGKELQSLPRPSLLLDPPRLLTDAELVHLRFLTSHPTERLMGEWWNEERPSGRDYFFATNEDGRLWWIYRDCLSKKHYLHGAFD